MYASLVMLTLGPGKRSTGEKLADQFAPALKTLKGFKRVTFLGDDAVGEYGSLSLWESKEDLEAAAAVLGPKLEQAVSGIAKSPPTRQFFEVYEPKA
jgi:heme-degrading monooxygenase HmoA